MSATPEQQDQIPPPPEASLDLAARIERAQAISRPTTRLFSRRAVTLVVAAFVVVGAAAGFVDNFLNAHVVNPTPSAQVVTTSTLPVRPAASTPGSLAALLSLAVAHGPAPAFRLVDQAGTPVSLGALRGKVVVLSFFDAACDDICPVVAAELRTADRLLGNRAADVAFLTVDTDPLLTGPAAATRGAAASGLGGAGGLANWHFLTGSLASLDRVWKAYGISIDVQTATKRVSHNNLLWIVAPDGRLAYEATPFANEQRTTGAYRLRTSTETRFAAGIAHYALQLLSGPHAAR